jgi:hypothetical protein
LKRVVGVQFRIRADTFLWSFRSWGLAVVALAVLATPTSAAYIDPISGSVLVQIVAAAALAGVATIRSWGSRLRAVFRHGKDDRDEQPGKSEE